jgi:hypothetical protein
MTFLAIAAGAAIGSFIGNTFVFFVIGGMAQRTEKKRLAEFQQFQQFQAEMQEAMTQETERMQRYAKMEG